MTQGQWERCSVHRCRKKARDDGPKCDTHAVWGKPRTARSKVRERIQVTSGHERIDQHIQKVVYDILKNEGLIE